MTKLNELKNILGEYFKWNKARLDCFAQMLLSIFLVRTVNLSEVAVGIFSEAEINSRYRRLQRFFSEFKFNYDWLAKLIFKLFFTGKKVYVTIDRTNWFWGKAKINILTLGIAYEGIAIPLLWCLLDKAGNAKANEHQAILERFVDLFGQSCIAGVLADREFASGELFEFLNKQEIPFYIRIKEGAIVFVKKKKFSTAKKIFRHLNLKEGSAFQMTVWIFGQKVYLAGSRSERGELMIVATNQLPSNAVAIYLRRWEIETLFSCLKGRGFRFEDTHLTAHDRIEKMMAVLAVGFCWAHKTGEWRAIKKPIRVCKRRHGSRLQNSYFRYGLDFIRDLISNPFKKLSEFTLTLKILFFPPIQETSP